MRHLKLILMAVAIFALSSCSDYKYEKVSNDPLGTRIYTLENGLKVYLSVNKEQPRIQTIISVRVGAKNDPAETTGLAHYFEHLMFKGTDKFGTSDYEAEKPLLDQIEALFEQYRVTTDPQQRKDIYAQIDQLSQQASKYSIPNEYDKLIQSIGGDGCNAWTSYDETSYMSEIPSNQVENWAKIESERFKNAVIRGFHTELETVYEEYNMSLTRDNNKVIDKFLALMMPNHPYGQHSVLGKQEHLKNPSITNIKNYYNTYYVPNNMAVCLSGDFNPDEVIKIIDNYFGDMTPNQSLPDGIEGEITPVTEPRKSEVWGLEGETLFAGWLTGAANSEDALMLEIVSSVLSNGNCGLIDINLTQQQKVLYGSASADQLSDAGFMMLFGMPKQGQTLEQVEALLLEQVAALRSGEFDESILNAIIANYKRDLMVSYEDNFARCYAMALSFINENNWADVVSKLDRASKITKADVVAWACEKLTEDTMVTVYKRQGEDKNQKKIDKPQITPIATNRDSQSNFLKAIASAEVEPIAPRFTDYERDMDIWTLDNGIEVLYKQNELNERFELVYLYDFGIEKDPALSVAREYISLLGTDEKSLAQIMSEQYELACDVSFSPSKNNFYVTVSGIAENMPQAMALAEDYMANVKGDEDVLAEVKNDIIKERTNNKTNQRANYSALQRYVCYGADYVARTTLNNEQLMALESEALLDKIRSLKNYQHRILYYGPLSKRELTALLNKHHAVAEQLIPVEYQSTPTAIVTEPKVVFAQYDAKQIYYMQYACGGDMFDVKLDPQHRLYNEYFSGGMNAIVFQEMREARGLAYSSYAYMGQGSTCNEPYHFYAFIATQNDKMQQAIEAFDEIIENMPQSEAAFELTKQGLITGMATGRTTKMDVLWNYIGDMRFGITDFNRTEAVYNGIQTMTLADVVNFQQNHIKGRNYVYCILGDKNDVDMKYLKTLGDVEFVTSEQIFGY
ncbi:MAG: insulinase family protein [Alistipes sp.]|nr:insulinase family protein [Alistipes sp.]